MEEFIRANREMWEDRVDVHKDSKFYDVEGFLQGKQTLPQIPWRPAQIDGNRFHEFLHQRKAPSVSRSLSFLQMPPP